MLFFKEYVCLFMMIIGSVNSNFDMSQRIKKKLEYVTKFNKITHIYHFKNGM